MTRSEIEKVIIQNLEALFKPHGFVKAKENLYEHFFIFFKRGNDVDFDFSLQFLKYGGLAPNFGVSSRSVTDLYHQISDDKNDFYRIFSCSVLTLLNPKNKGDELQTFEEIKSIHGDLISNGKKLDMVSKNIFQTYFLNVFPNLMSKFGDLNNVDKLLNDNLVRLKPNGRPTILVYSAHSVSQAMSGVLVAKAVNRSNLPEILKAYQKSLEEFPQGEREDVDLIRKAIQKFQ